MSKKMTILIKEYISVILTIALLMLFSVSLTSCKQNDQNSNDSEVTGDGEQIEIVIPDDQETFGE